MTVANTTDVAGTTNATDTDHDIRRRRSLQEGYLPPARPYVDASLPLHTEQQEEDDVVLAEIIRNKLWNINVDHGEVLRRVSGSNIVIEGYDFNCAITTEIGDAVTCSPFSMFFAGIADAVIKWTLEFRSTKPGIRPGDIFVQDDPWVGSNHQMDTATFAPLFLDGELYAWVFNCVHQREIGGLEPGGLVQSARDVYAEPTFMPPVKIAEAGELREDLVEAWVRRSRLPDLMTLELNSQISGVRLGLRRLSELVERYGKATVKRVMHRMIGDTSRVVASRLLSLPDAVWRDERYVAGASQGDMRLYRLCMQFEKRADRLRVSNWGTDAATGSINCTAGIFRAGVLNALLPTIAYDQYLCAAGVLRQLDFDVDTNAITSASHPAAVSTSMGSLLVINQAHALATKMVSGNDTLAPHAFATSSGHSFSSNTVFGIDQYGKPYSDALLDTLGGGLGAFSHRDGIDFGGRVTGVGGRFADVERFERVVPFLYLYRRVLRDSGGHGRWRGGATLAAAWLGHKTNESYIASGGLVKSVTTGKGAVGAYPATSGSHWHATDCDVEAWKSAGRFPADPGELRRLAPHGSLAPAKKYDNRLGATDVFELVGNPGAGWGDPLDRDPALVADDVRRRRLSHEDARRVYAVVLTEDGTVDDDATAACRRATREERLFRAGPPLAEPPAVATDVPSVEQPLPAVSETVAMLRVDGTTSLLVCRRCHAPLGDGHHGYRRGCAKLDMDLEDIGPYYTSPRDEVQVRLVYRQYLCPRCGSIVDGDVCRAEDEPYNDLRLL